MDMLLPSYFVAQGYAPQNIHGGLVIWFRCFLFKQVMFRFHVIFFWGVVCFGTPIDTPRITLRNCLVEDGIKKNTAVWSRENDQRRSWLYKCEESLFFLKHWFSSVSSFKPHPSFCYRFVVVGICRFFFFRVQHVPLCHSYDVNQPGSLVFWTTLPKFNSSPPEKWWLEDICLSFWDGVFSGANKLNFQVGT